MGRIERQQVGSSDEIGAVRAPTRIEAAIADAKAKGLDMAAELPSGVLKPHRPRLGYCHGSILPDSRSDGHEFLEIVSIGMLAVAAWKGGV
jgi:hypothetical protein